MGLFTQLMRSFTAGLEEPTRTGDGHPSGDSQHSACFCYIAIQVENESGNIGSIRDNCDSALCIRRARNQ
jgi:hypothetical protein